VDVATALHRYIRHHKAAGSTPKTVDWHALSVGQFSKFLAAQGHSGDVADLGNDDLRSYIDRLQGQGLAQASIATKVRSIRAWGRWLVDEEYLARDPFQKVKRPRVDDVAKHTLAPEDVDRILAKCDRKTVTGLRDFAMLLTLYSTGLRASELLNLTLDDLNVDQGLMTVRRGKGGKGRVVPLSRPVERAIQRYLDHAKRCRFAAASHVFLTYDGQPLAVEGLQAVVRRRGERAGVKAYAHLFRHSAAVAFLRRGGRLEHLRLLLGHAEFSTTLRYGRLAAVDVAEAHATADPARGLKVRV
jgi:site-specific recombinase XerD